MNALELNHPYRTSERQLWICVVASVLLHALVVLNMHGVDSASAPPAPLRATIRAEPKPAPALAPAAPPQAKPEPPKPELKPAMPPEPPKAVPRPLVADKAPAKTAESAPKVAPTPTPAPPQPAPSVAPAVPATDAKADTKAEAKAVPSSVGQGNGEDIVLINGYQAQLYAVAQKYKRYPQEAIEQKQEGTVTIVLRIGSDGMIAASEIEASSGHDLLDQKAREAALKAKPLVQVPPGLKGRPFTARVKLQFDLSK